MAYLVEEKHLSRKVSCAIILIVTWSVGLLCSLSFGPLSGVKLFGNTIFDFFDKLTANYLMTIGSLLVVLFVGWKMKKSDVRDEFTNDGTLKANSSMFGIVYALIKYIAPIAVLTIFISNLIF